MTSSEQVTASLREHGPQSYAQLRETTGLNRQSLARATGAMKKEGTVHVSGTCRVPMYTLVSLPLRPVSFVFDLGQQALLNSQP